MYLFMLVFYYYNLLATLAYLFCNKLMHYNIFLLLLLIFLTRPHFAVRWIWFGRNLVRNLRIFLKWVDQELLLHSLQQVKGFIVMNKRFITQFSFFSSSFHIFYSVIFNWNSELNLYVKKFLNFLLLFE